MKTLVSFCSLILLMTARPAQSADISMDALNEALQKDAAKFVQIGPVVTGKPLPFKLSLGASTIKLADHAEFGGFRFKAPEDLAGADFVWYSNAPANWGNWYILPLSGKAGPAFKDWLNADKVYQQFDTAGATNRLRVLQTLSSAYFQAGQEYLIWFRKVEDGANDELQGMLAFAKSREAWDFGKIESSLSLEPQPAAEQVKQLDSRGGRILLDERFFKKGYAADRIDDVFFSLRQTRFLRGGTFITMETSIPPCKTDPPIAEIKNAFGEPDFIVSAKEKSLLSSEDKKEPETVTYYYDYFGFEVAADDPQQRVLQVVATAANFSTLRPKNNGACYTQLPLKNLTCFYRDQKEVGRMYFFLDGGEKPIVVQEPPTGTYQGEEGKLECLGGGKWQLNSFFENGKPARTVPFEGNRMNGTAEGYYPDGHKKFQATYKDGELDGEVVQYSESGQEKRSHFKAGKKVEN